MECREGIRQAGLAAGLAAALVFLSGHPEQARAEGSRASFRVNISFVPAPSVCATQSLTGPSGAAARVTCLTSGLPSFSTPGRPDFVAIGIGAAMAGPAQVNMVPGAGPGGRSGIETAARTPSSVSVDGLAATASVAGAPATPMEGGAAETSSEANSSSPGQEANADRSLRGAEFRGDRQSAPPQEIEVSF